MFHHLIDDAQSAAGAVIAKYAVRASVAVPFVVALGFATAAMTVLLVERLGPIAAFSAVATVFTVVGLVAMFIVQAREHHHEPVEQVAAVAPGQEVVSDASGAAASPVPMALLATLVSATGGPASLMGIARLVGRNLPLVALTAVIGVLLLQETKSEEPESDADLADRSNGSGPPATETTQPPP